TSFSLSSSSGRADRREHDHLVHRRGPRARWRRPHLRRLRADISHSWKAARASSLPAKRGGLTQAQAHRRKRRGPSIPLSALALAQREIILDPRFPTVPPRAQTALLVAVSAWMNGDGSWWCKRETWRRAYAP